MEGSPHAVTGENVERAQKRSGARSLLNEIDQDITVRLVGEDEIPILHRLEIPG
jgi:hypothetical protein